MSVHRAGSGESPPKFPFGCEAALEDRDPTQQDDSEASGQSYKEQKLDQVHAHEFEVDHVSRILEEVGHKTPPMSSRVERHSAEPLRKCRRDWVAQQLYEDIVDSFTSHR